MRWKLGKTTYRGVTLSCPTADCSAAQRRRRDGDQRLDESHDRQQDVHRTPRRVLHTSSRTNAAPALRNRRRFNRATATL